MVCFPKSFIINKFMRPSYKFLKAVPSLLFLFETVKTMNSSNAIKGNKTLQILVIC